MSEKVGKRIGVQAESVTVEVGDYDKTAKCRLLSEVEVY